jgi:hypothetical protein
MEEEEEIYICSSRLGLIKMDHRHSGNTIVIFHLGREKGNRFSHHHTITAPPPDCNCKPTILQFSGVRMACTRWGEVILATCRWTGHSVLGTFPIIGE